MHRISFLCNLTIAQPNGCVTGTCTNLPSSKFEIAFSRSVLVMLDGSRESSIRPLWFQIVGAGPSRGDNNFGREKWCDSDGNRRHGTLRRALGHRESNRFLQEGLPETFDVGSVAYWRVPRRFRKSALNEIQKVTQCVLELSRSHLRIIKAEGHPSTVQGRLFRVTHEKENFGLQHERAQGRLAEELQRLRIERSLSQAEIGRLADVSASAISQAEAGQRGLSLDTLLILTSELGIGLDELLENQHRPEYVLARRDRGPQLGESRFLVDDPSAGLRVYLANLGPGERGTPPIKHKGAELVLVARGLVLVDLGSSSPAVRAGDAILATKVPVLSWQDLAPQRSVLFWILRD